MEYLSVNDLHMYQLKEISDVERYEMSYVASKNFHKNVHTYANNILFLKFFYN